MCRCLISAAAPVFSGLALKDAGFTNLTGSEVNAAMLEKGTGPPGIYRDLMLVEMDNPFDFPAGIVISPPWGDRDRPCPGLNNRGCS